MKAEVAPLCGDTKAATYVGRAGVAQPPARKASGLEGGRVIMKFYVYLLRSQKDNNFYIGQTNNVGERVIKHNAGKVRSTSERKPWSLLGFVEVASRKEALQIEKDLKNHSDKKKAFIRRFLKDFDWNMPG